MYSVLRINGKNEQIEKLHKILKENNSALSPEINRRNDLVCNLSLSLSPDHWEEVADALEQVSESIVQAKTGDIGLLVDTMFNLKQLPDGGIVIDTLQVSQTALEAMTKIGSDFEVTIYPPAVDDK